MPDAVWHPLATVGNQVHTVFAGMTSYVGTLPSLFVVAAVGAAVAYPMIQPAKRYITQFRAQRVSVTAEQNAWEDGLNAKYVD